MFSMIIIIIIIIIININNNVPEKHYKILTILKQKTIENRDE